MFHQQLNIPTLRDQPLHSLLVSGVTHILTVHLMERGGRGRGGEGERGRGREGEGGRGGRGRGGEGEREREGGERGWRLVGW